MIFLGIPVNKNIRLTVNYEIIFSIDLLHNNLFCYNYDFSAANNSPLVNEYAVFTSSRFVVFARKIIISLRKVIMQEILCLREGNPEAISTSEIEIAEPVLSYAKDLIPRNDNIREFRNSQIYLFDSNDPMYTGSFLQ